MKRLMVCIGIALALAPAAYAAGPTKAPASESKATESWSAWGGVIGIRWNFDLMKNLGIEVESRAAQLAKVDRERHEWYALREAGGLVFGVRDAALQKFEGGSLTVTGGPVLRLVDGTRIDLRNATLRVNAHNPLVLDVVSADGKVWLYTDRIMFELTDGNRTLTVHTADLRMTPGLAAKLRAPEADGWALGDFAMSTEVTIQGTGAQPDRTCKTYPWPGADVPNVPGAKYQADLFMQSISIQTVGCQSCGGPNGNGLAAFAPSSTLRNNVNDGVAQATIPGDPLGTSTALHTADVAWFQKFTGNYPPYGNDQHPFLIWNLYRLDADGGLRQIGRSGVKHAFVSTNTGCTSTCGVYGGHALGLGCADTYSSSNNDSPEHMGPRSEIIPATGQWGRCGSIYDPNCDGVQNSSGNTAWTQRMKVPEKKLAHPAGDGSGFLFESWYIVRDDINIYNSMATLTVNPQFSGSQWALTGASNYRLGGAIDRWVDPANPGSNAKNVELATPEGHAKVAVKVTDLGNGQWRYHYAVMNFDFARAETQGSEPNLRVLSNRGFDRFSVSVPAGVTILSPSSDVGDETSATNWRARIAGGAITWSTDASVGGIGSSTRPPATTLPTLDWGTLYAFSFISTAPPANASAILHVATAGSPAQYEVQTLGPAAPQARR